MWKATIKTTGTLWRSPKITKEVKEAMKKTAKFAKDTIQADTPVDTGEMRRSWRVVPYERSLLIVNNANHAGFIEYGTRRIEPRRPMGKNMDKIAKFFKDTLVAEIKAKIADTGRGLTDLRTAEATKAKITSISDTYPKKV